MSGNNEQKRRAQKSTIQINLNDLPTIGCPTCGGMIFETNKTIYKILGALQSPNGKEQMVSIMLSFCVNCGAISQVVGGELKLVELEILKNPLVENKGLN